ncbi:hydrolase [Allostella sp. ATCC 35155]|nr:hydrolase [Stella sp. ATCC 35155]
MADGKAAVEPVVREFRQFFNYEFTQIRYRRWGARTAPRRAVLVHGFMQNGCEHSRFASRLVAAGWCVYGVDLPGHGLSGRRRNPADYSYEHYAATLSTMLALAGGTGVDLYGNSMGGFIAMLLAATPGASIRSLVLNDIATEWHEDGIRWFIDNTPQTDRFPSEEAARAAAGSLLRLRGTLPQSEWDKVFDYLIFRDGPHWRARFDPALRRHMETLESKPIHWAQWQRIACPTLLIRGADSNMLAADTAARMVERQPRCELLTFPDAGHSPWLRMPDQIDPVVEWMQRQ